MNEYSEVIFVCANDTGRGPMGAAIMKSKFIHSPVKISSRGMVVLFPEPLNQKVEAVMISNQLSVENHIATQLSENDFAYDHLIIVMDTAAKEKIYEEYKNAQNVFVLTELIGDEGEVPNPYGKSVTEYGMCYEVMNSMITKLVKKINKEEL